jgi:hypothetical protein
MGGIKLQDHKELRKVVRLWENQMDGNGLYITGYDAALGVNPLKYDSFQIQF